MANDILTVQGTLSSIIEILQTSFWKRTEFWISSVIGLGSLGFSLAAFLQASMAKRAAIDAGQTVKLQSITVDLTEISQKIERIEPDISFNEARDLQAEISRRLRRIVAPLQDDPQLNSAIKQLLDAVTATKDSLNKVRPSLETSAIQPLRAVYNAIEAEFATINDIVAHLSGLLENKTIKFGKEKHADKST